MLLFILKLPASIKIYYLYVFISRHFFLLDVVSSLPPLYSSSAASSMTRGLGLRRQRRQCPPLYAPAYTKRNTVHVHATSPLPKLIHTSADIARLHLGQSEITSTSCTPRNIYPIPQNTPPTPTQNGRPIYEVTNIHFENDSFLLSENDAPRAEYQPPSPAGTQSSAESDDSNENNLDEDEFGDGLGEELNDEVGEDGGDPAENEPLPGNDIDDNDDMTGEPPDSDPPAEATVGSVLDINPMSIWALIQTAGRRKLSCEQYESIRVMIRAVASLSTFNQHLKLPHYRTLTRGLKPRVMDNLAIPAHRLDLPIDVSVAGAKANRIQGSDPPQCRLSCISVWDYARFDVRNPIFFEHLKKANRSGLETEDLPNTLSAESSRLIRNRAWFFGGPSHIGVESPPTEPLFQYAEQGDTIRISSFRQMKSCDDDCTAFINGRNRVLSGTISSVFMLYDASDKQRLSGHLARFQTDLRSDQIRNALEFSVFQWPTRDPMESLPEMERCNKQPGDIVAVLRPTEGQSQARILLFHRFITWSGERERFILYIPGDRLIQNVPPGSLENIQFENYIAPTCSTAARFSYIKKVELIEAHEGSRGPEKVKPVPLLGTLKNDEKYVIYRCTLFIDAFSSSSLILRVHVQSPSFPPGCL